LHPFTCQLIVARAGRSGGKVVKEMGDGLDASRGMIGFAAGFRGWIGVGVGGIGL